MSEPGDPASAAVAIAAALESAGIDYAIGGALAYGLWGIPRATKDVDLNVFVEPDGVRGVIDTLLALGVSLDVSRATKDAEEQGMFVGWFGLWRVDVFTPSIDFSWEAKRTRKRQSINGTSVWVLSAEALAVFKLLFFRGKDVVDLERLVGVQKKRMDLLYVRAQLVEMMGEADERVKKWDELCRAFAGDD